MTNSSSFAQTKSEDAANLFPMGARLVANSPFRRVACVCRSSGIRAIRQGEARPLSLRRVGQCFRCWEEFQVRFKTMRIGRIIKALAFPKRIKTFPGAVWGKPAQINL